MAEIPLFPLRTVLFPGATLPLQIFEERYKVMLRRCVEQEQPFGVVLIRSGPEVGGGATPYDIGSTARIVTVEPAADDRFNIVTVGARRFRVLRLSFDQPYLTGEVEFLSDEDEDAAGIEESVAQAGALFTEYSKLVLALSDQWTRHVALPKRPGAVADHIAAQVQVEPQTKQLLLEELSVPRRLQLEIRLLEAANEQLGERVAQARQVRFSAFGVLN